MEYRIIGAYRAADGAHLVYNYAYQNNEKGREENGNDKDRKDDKSSKRSESSGESRKSGKTGKSHQGKSRKS